MSRYASVCPLYLVSKSQMNMYLIIFALTVAEHLIAQHNSVKMLHERIRIVLNYIKAVEQGSYDISVLVHY
jgi:hypothetical protein